MKFIKGVGLACAIMVMAACGTVAKAQWSYNWNGSVDGYADANPDVNGYGGRFNAAVTYNGVQQAFGSYCNELGQDALPGPQIPLQVLSLANLTSTDLTKGTNGAGADSGLHTAGAVNLGALEWVVANHFDSAAGQATLETSLQLAIWKLWGFNNIAQYSTDANASSWVTDAIANHSNYQNANVLWVRLAQDVHGNDTMTQDQIVYVDSLATPEASSLALLLPGLIPVAIAVRRRARKA